MKFIKRNICSNCKYWGDEEEINGYEAKFSRCRRFPPTALPYDVMNEDIDAEEIERLGRRNMLFDFPWTSEYEECGEFRVSIKNEL